MRAETPIPSMPWPSCFYGFRYRPFGRRIAGDCRTVHREVQIARRSQGWTRCRCQDAASSGDWGKATDGDAREPTPRVDRGIARLGIHRVDRDHRRYVGVESIRPALEDHADEEGKQGASSSGRMKISESIHAARERRPERICASCQRWR